MQKQPRRGIPAHVLLIPQTAFRSAHVLLDRGPSGAAEVSPASVVAGSHVAPTSHTHTLIDSLIRIHASQSSQHMLAPTGTT